MNFARSGLAVGNLVAQRCRQITEMGFYRGMCKKPTETKADTQPAVPPHEPHHTFKLATFRPSNMDRKFLIWTGRFKTPDQIPEFVSYEMIEVARNRMRIKFCYAMIAATLAGCAAMIYLGKQAAHRNESLAAYNLEKQARWREEAKRERELNADVSQKAQ
ncbi:protein FAM162B [Thalassophryne amazonica]|uniref:protein FAM162B n=1 Tax=Thalassophryne amazonica TaxID=390379 RepID=UPI001471B53B|nr:protein FAM162B [Thalassophryne amazonica]